MSLATTPSISTNRWFVSLPRKRSSVNEPGLPDWLMLIPGKPRNKSVTCVAPDACISCSVSTVTEAASLSMVIGLRDPVTVMVSTEFDCAAATAEKPAEQAIATA